MPKPALPPTPTASTELIGKEHNHILPPERAFRLPPPAYKQRSTLSDQAHDDATLALQSDNATPIHEIKGASVSHSSKSSQRKRTASQVVEAEEEPSLPPPPSRQRKIIQVKPKGQRGNNNGKDAQDQEQASTKSNAGSLGKKKQGAAGRKIARKTAHSLIERRRRSKMNEEFGVLKDMIPACEGQDMHKLAILHASIEYMRYLKQCLDDIRPGKPNVNSAASSVHTTRPPSAATTRSCTRTTSLDQEDDGYRQSLHEPIIEPQYESQAASISAVTSPIISGAAPSPSFHSDLNTQHSKTRSGQTFVFPLPLGNRFPTDQSYAPYNTSAPATSPFAHSNQASPTLLPQSSHSSAPSEMDQEASAALLMLNASDRRVSTSKEWPEQPIKQELPEPRGISVKDLLRN